MRGLDPPAFGAQEFKREKICEILNVICNKKVFGGLGSVVVHSIFVWFWYFTVLIVM